MPSYAKKLEGFVIFLNCATSLCHYAFEVCLSVKIHTDTCFQCEERYSSQRTMMRVYFFRLKVQGEHQIGNDCWRQELKLNLKNFSSSATNLVQNDDGDVSTMPLLSLLLFPDPANQALV